MFKQSHINIYLSLKKKKKLQHYSRICHFNRKLVSHSEASFGKDAQINNTLRPTQHLDIYTVMFQCVRCLSINKLQIQSDIHASLRAGDELVVL